MMQVLMMKTLMILHEIGIASQIDGDVREQAEPVTALILCSRLGVTSGSSLAWQLSATPMQLPRSIGCDHDLLAALQQPDVFLNLRQLRLIDLLAPPLGRRVQVERQAQEL